MWTRRHIAVSLEYFKFFESLRRIDA